MKAEPLSVGRVLSENQRFVVPIYQRTYTWTAKNQLEPLWEQIQSKATELLAGSTTQFPHYMGSLLVVPEGEAAFGQLQSYDVVDGQQRITTFHLLFAALRSIARELEYSSFEKNIEGLLLFPSDAGPFNLAQGRYKLQPTQDDRAVFRHLVDLDSVSLREKYGDFFYGTGLLKKTKAPVLLAAYYFFYEHIWAFLDADPDQRQSRFRSVSETAFQSFRFIVITLAKEDDPQVIFETLNTGGAPLAAMDLVKNDVFLRAIRRNEEAERLMQEYWSMFSGPFWKDLRTQGRLKKPTMDFFLTHALGAETGKLISASEVYSEYKNYSRALNTSVEGELRAITKYVPHYKTLLSPTSKDPLGRLGYLLEVFDTSTAFPTILLIAAAPVEAQIKVRLYELVGSYVIRRALCGLTAKNYNIFFRELTSELRAHGVSESSFLKFVDLKKESEAARFPDNDEVTRAIASRSQYGVLPVHRLRFVLGELELAARDKYSASSDLKADLWVEHIMPQSWRDEWPLRSGRKTPEKNELLTDQSLIDEVATRDQAIQNLGNLTLLTPASNVSAGCASFEDKKSRLIGSLTTMNAGVAQLAKWDEDDIKKRSLELAERTNKLWPYPTETIEPK